MAAAAVQCSGRPTTAAAAAAGSVSRYSTENHSHFSAAARRATRHDA